MSRRRKILFIDDSHEDLATYSTYLLSSTEGDFIVATASSSTAGIGLSASFQPDCLVIDLDIDTLDGLEVLVRTRERAGNVPTIMLTGHGSERAAVEALKLGAWTYLVKAETTPQALTRAVVDAINESDLQAELGEQRRREERARAELERSYKQARFLSGVSEILIASMERDAIVERVAREVVDHVADACYIDLVIDGVLHRAGAASKTGATTEIAVMDERRYAPHIDGREGVARVLRSGEAALYGATWLDTLVPYDNDVADLFERGLTSVAIVPLTFDRKILGTVTFAACAPRAAYGASDVRHFVELGRRLSMAIANADLYASEQRARSVAESAQRRLSITSQASSLFARSLEWRETLERLVRILIPDIADWVGIFVIEKQPVPTFELVASRHADAKLARAYAERCRAFSLSGALHESRSKLRPDFHPDGLPPAGPDAEGSGLIDRLRPAGVRSYIAVPIVAHGELSGSLVVLNDSDRAPFELDDLSLVEDLGRRIAMYLEQSSIVRREREIARMLQHSLLPDAIPTFTNLRFVTRYLPGTEGVHVGGDWYDAIAVGDHQVAFVIGDVSGRGIEAAAIMGKLRATVRAYLFDGSGPAMVLERANKAAESMGFDQFATVLCAVLDRSTGTLSIANAGHPPPILTSHNRCDVLDVKPGLPIGIVRTAVYSDLTITVDEGSTLLLYTDGLIETRTRFAADGIAELCRCARDLYDSDAERYIDKLLRAMTNGRHDDDVALVAVRRLNVPRISLERAG